MKNKNNELTTREIQILLLVIQNKTSSQIAELLNISPHTVEIHRSNILAKLEIPTRTQQLRDYAIKNGFVK